MTTDEIGVYLVDQVVNNSDSRTFNARIEGKVPVKSLLETKSSSSIQRPRSFTSDFKGNHKLHLPMLVSVPLLLYMAKLPSRKTFKVFYSSMTTVLPLLVMTVG